MATRCPFSEIVDLPDHERTIAQCPECGAHRTLVQAYAEGDVYRFPSHNRVTRREDRPAWHRVGGVGRDAWKWHTVQVQVDIVYTSEIELFTLE